uniref:nucleotidyltransferase family protein n=1 Tax=Dialister sp. TaxID=1955814 RepID=UPI003FF11AA9
MVRPLAKKISCEGIYLFGSYARGEADAQSDLDFLIFGGDGFRLTEILFSLMRHRIICSFLPSSGFSFLTSLTSLKRTESWRKRVF